MIGSLLNKIIDFFRPVYKVVKYKRRWFIKKRHFWGGEQILKKEADKWRGRDLFYARSYSSLYGFRNKSSAKRYLKDYLSEDKSNGRAEEEECYTKQELLRNKDHKDSEKSVLKK